MENEDPSKEEGLTLGADNLFDKAYYAPLSGMSLGDLKATGVSLIIPCPQTRSNPPQRQLQMA